MRRAVSNVSASVREKLRQLGEARGVSFARMLERYVLERLLYRLSLSPFRDRMVLKGAMLLPLWNQAEYRPTRDVDFLAYGDNAPERLASIFRELCMVAAVDDGLTFVADSVKAQVIKEGQQYEGVRIEMLALVGVARVRVQADIAFGDVVEPEIEDVEYPSLLRDFPRASVRAYPREAVISEKLQALVYLGRQNSRMKDFHDLWVLGTEYRYEADRILRAVRATFQRRGTPLPDGMPYGLSPEFFESPEKRMQWNGFVIKIGLRDVPFPDIGNALRSFLMPILTAVSGKIRLAAWPAGGPWQEK